MYGLKEGNECWRNWIFRFGQLIDGRQSYNKYGLPDTYRFLLGIINTRTKSCINGHSFSFKEAVKCFIGQTRRWVCNISNECLYKRVYIEAFCLPPSNVDNDSNVTSVKDSNVTSVNDSNVTSVKDSNVTSVKTCPTTIL